MDITIANFIADAILGLDSRDISAISRLLSLLGVSIQRNAQCIKPRLSISLDTDLRNEAIRAEFDVDTHRWRLTPTTSDPNSPCDRISHLLKPRKRSAPDITHMETEFQELPMAKKACDSGTASPEKELAAEEDDWTRQISRTPHNELLLSTHWENTSLGPMMQWSLILQIMTLKVLADPRPANLYWGKDRVAIYNEAFAVTACSRHPAMMGASAEVALPATWPFLGPMMQEVERSGKAFSMPEFEMDVHKDSGFLEEAWYDGVFFPINDTSGNFVGIYNSGNEITRSVTMARYTRLIHQLAATPDFTQTSPWKHIISSCEPFQNDVPLLVVYSADIKETLQSNRCILRFEGSLGVPHRHRAIYDTFDLDTTNDYFAPAFRSSKARGCPVLVDPSERRHYSFLDDMDWRGWREPSTHVVIMPVFATGLIAGFVVMGMNPRRPYNEDLEQFVDDVWKTSTSVVSSNISFEQARERERILARELTEREKFIRKLAEVATVGIFSVSNSCRITYANPRYYGLIGISQNPQEDQKIGFWHYVFHDDRLKVSKAFEQCRTKRTNVTIEVRLERKWTPPGMIEDEHIWVLASIMPNIEDDDVLGMIGSLTDIRHTMWALQLQKRSAEAAMESKRQQEKFIDMTSHEMRNPLGAITQCADDIFNSIEAGRAVKGDAKAFEEYLEAMRENAKTILFCTAHQKTIVDDILTVSKLSSSLLAISPALEQPALIAKEVLQMFDVETSKSGIEMTFELSGTYDLTWAFCDASRLRQVLINLLTNAIKFTKGRASRKIHVILGACTTAPPAHMNKLSWYPKKSQTPPSFCAGDEVFLTFEIQDSGKGMTEEEMSHLFNRFAQASPVTSSVYGGSGLGLFISMQLTELQGGKIGISSKPGSGSNFGFYIKVRRETKLETETRRMKEICEISRPRTKSPTSTGTLDIMLVEDNLINQKVLSKQLRKLGHRVHVANHGVEALDLLQKTKYWRDKAGPSIGVDVILMDWEMPVMDGLTCTTRIRELERDGLITEHLPVIGTTANTRAEQKEKAFAAGIDKFLAKPFTVEQLLTVINSGT